jgi:hypothetical protein
VREKMKISKWGIMVGIIVFVLLFSYLKMKDIERRTEKPFIGWSEYRNEEHSFSLEYPKGWDVKKNEPFGVVVGFIGPRKQDSVASMSVVVTYLEKPIDFGTVLEDNLNAAKQKDETFEMLSFEMTQINGSEAWIVRSKIGKSNKISRLIFSIIKCNDTKIMMVTGGVHTRIYDELEPLFLHTINSVKC